MKKIILFFSLFLSFGLLFGQINYKQFAKKQSFYDQKKEKSNCLLDSLYTFYYDTNFDTLLDYPNNKIEYFYDNTGKTYEEIEYKWDLLSNGWNKIFKYEYPVDSLTKLKYFRTFYWDSIENIWKGEEYEEYIYNEFGNKIFENTYVWDLSLNNWINNDRDSIVFDEKGNIISLINVYWDYNLNDWINSYKIIKLYDDNNNLISNTEYYWNSIYLKWYPSLKNEYSYDTNKNKNIEYFFTYEENSDSIVFKTKREYFYDTNNNKILAYSYSWDDSINNWIYNNKLEYEYDEKNRKIVYTYKTWNNIGSFWGEQERRYYNYDSITNIIEEQRYYKGILTSKFEYLFNEFGYQTLNVQYYWNSIEWVGVQKYTYEYNKFKHLTKSTENKWDSSFKNWIEFHKIEQTFDENENLLLYTSSNLDLNNKWIIEFQVGYEYFCNSPVLNKNQPTSSNFTIFPNPTTKNITISSENFKGESNVELFSLDGKLVYTNKFNSKSASFELPNISKGLYLFKVQNENSVRTEKLILE